MNYLHGGLKQVTKLFEYINIYPHCSIYETNSGFHEGINLFKSQHNNFAGNSINIVMPNVSLAFSKVWTYPDYTRIRSGSDFSTAQYLSKALNFKFQSVLCLNHASVAFTSFSHFYAGFWIK